MQCRGGLGQRRAPSSKDTEVPSADSRPGRTRFTIELPAVLFEEETWPES